MGPSRSLVTGLLLLQMVAAGLGQDQWRSFDSWEELKINHEKDPKSYVRELFATELQHQVKAVAFGEEPYDEHLSRWKGSYDESDWLDYDEDESEEDNEDEDDDWDDFDYQQRQLWGFFKKMGNAFKSAGNSVGSGFKSAGNRVGSGFKSAGNRVGSGFKSAGNAVVRTANKAGNGIKDTANKAGNGIKDTANKAGRGIVDTANKARTGIKDTAVKAGEGVKQGAFVVGGALGIPGTGPDHDKIQKELEAKIRGLKQPKRSPLTKNSGFTLAEGQTGVHYETVPQGRMDKNMAIFMGNVIMDVEKKMKAANLDFKNLDTNEASEKAFAVVDGALASNSLLKAVRRNQVTKKSIRKSSTDLFKVNGKPTSAQKEDIKNTLKGMINDNEIWFSFANTDVGDDKIDLINEAFSQTGVTVTSLVTLIRGTDHFRVHVADFAYLKFPKDLDQNSNLKIYYLAVDAWFESVRTLFVEKNSAGLDFQMRVSEFAADNAALKKLDTNTKEKNADFVKDLGFDFSSDTSETGAKTDAKESKSTEQKQTTPTPSKPAPSRARPAPAKNPHEGCRYQKYRGWVCSAKQAPKPAAGKNQRKYYRKPTPRKRRPVNRRVPH